MKKVNEISRKGIIPVAGKKATLMENSPKRQLDITFLINAHKEGAILIPAIRSAKRAAQVCREKNITVEIILIGDKVDSLTKQIILQNSAEFDDYRFVEHGNLGHARRDGITLSQGQFLCFLDGDDVWQDTWPSLAYSRAMASEYMNTIYHTEVFAGFGGTNFFRKQIRSSDAIFHPLHLCATWHFCNNLFAHHTIFERVPIAPYDHDKGYGSEDWHWSCETLAHGIARDYVPETAYFYRINNNKTSLGALKGLVMKPSKIFQDAALLESYSRFSGLTGSESLDELSNAVNLSYRHVPSTWLYQELRKAAGIEYSIHGLLKRSGHMVCETPELSPVTALAFSAVGKFCQNEAYDVFALDCELVNAKTATLVGHGLRKEAALGRKIVILCGNTLTKGKLIKQDHNILYVNYKILMRAHGELSYFADQWMGNWLSNYKPDCIINFNSEFVDWFSGTYRAFIVGADIRMTRVLISKVHDLGESYWERRILGNIQQGNYCYSEIWARDEESKYYLEKLYFGTTVYIGLLDGEMDSIANRIYNNSGIPAKNKDTKHSPFLNSSNGQVKVDVTCVLNAHREGIVAVPTLRSIARMLQHSKKRGVVCELIIVLDNSDTATENIIYNIINDEPALTGTRVFRVTNRELGRSRRFGVEAALGEYVAFLDADDMYSANWITEALRTCRSSPELDLVCHPEINVYFGKDHRLQWHADELRHKDTPHQGLLLENYWTSLSFSKRSTYLSQPVADNDIENGFGYEDWHWNMEAIARGIIHATAPATCHFIRLKTTDSLNKASSARGVITRPSEFAKKLLWGQIGKREPDAPSRS